MKQGNNKDKTQHNGDISKKMNVSMEEGTRVTHFDGNMVYSLYCDF